MFLLQLTAAELSKACDVLNAYIESAESYSSPQPWHSLRGERGLQQMFMSTEGINTTLSSTQHIDASLVEAMNSATGEEDEEVCGAYLMSHPNQIKA